MKSIRKVLLLLTAVALVSVTSCTENERARRFGGSATTDLPAGQKLVNVTWKDAQMWYLTRPMRADDVAETYTFQEKSSWGVLEGTFVLRETK